MTVANSVGGDSVSSPVMFNPGNFDPFMPIPIGSGSNPPVSSGTRQKQRRRRSEIYASIRRLLASGGGENVTVRNIAGISGYAVQTLYNLVGKRDEAISEAITEYKFFVGLTSAINPEHPMSLPYAVNGWFNAVSRNPDLERQSNLIYFTGPRAIYYRIRDRQVYEMRKLLMQQKNCGIIKDDVDTNSLSEFMVYYTCANWLEWADCDLPLNNLRQRIGSSFATLLKDKVYPQYRDIVADSLAESVV